MTVSPLASRSALASDIGAHPVLAAADPAAGDWPDGALDLDMPDDAAMACDVLSNSP